MKIEFEIKNSALLKLLKGLLFITSYSIFTFFHILLAVSLVAPLIGPIPTVVSVSALFAVGGQVAGSHIYFWHWFCEYLKSNRRSYYY